MRALLAEAGWLVHNVVVHPVCGVLWALRADRLADWLHEHGAPQELRGREPAQEPEQ